MRELNGTYLGHHDTTDVLTFPLHEASDKELVAEIYVNVDQARRQARTYGVTIRNELSRLVIHGVLHLVGYDDTTKPGKEKMKRREDHYLEDHL